MLKKFMNEIVYIVPPDVYTKNEVLDMLTKLQEEVKEKVIQFIHERYESQEVENTDINKAVKVLCDYISGSVVQKLKAENEGEE